jgi:hypothetical protein
MSMKLGTICLAPGGAVARRPRVGGSVLISPSPIGTARGRTAELLSRAECPPGFGTYSAASRHNSAPNCANVRPRILSREWAFLARIGPGIASESR